MTDNLPPIQFTSKKIELTDTLKDFADNKFQRLKHHAKKIISIHLTLKVNKLRQTAKASLHLPGKEIYASIVSEDLYKSIDLLVDNLVDQLTKTSQ